MHTRLNWAILLLISTSLHAQQTQIAQDISLAEAKPVISAYENKLPNALSRAATQSPQEWASYVRQRNRELKTRLQQGDLDTLANLLLFGTSYTKAPVITPALLNEISSGISGKQDSSAWNTYKQRLHDLTLGLASPRENQRLMYMRNLVESKGFHFRTPAELDEVQRFLATNLVRMLRDDQSFAAALETARKADADAEFRARSQVFEQRGISLDTSLFPNLALEQALRKLRDRGLLKAGSVERIAVVGPGLDVINKDAGFDFYPEQTIQPFALIDSLLRLGLAKPGQLNVTTLDISSNVNTHLKTARQRALSGKGYTLQLPLREDVHWAREAISYWQSFGANIGKPVPALTAPGATGKIKLRAIQIPSSTVLHISPADLNVVLQHLELPAKQRFDLMIGTNIFVYYGEFEQALAEVNMAHMLKPDGILLTNDALPTGGNSALEEIDFSTTIYSDRYADGDRIVWMRPKKFGYGLR